MKRLVCIFALLFLCAWADNNIVTTLRIAAAETGQSIFVLERAGWVRVLGALPEKVTFKASSGKEVAVLSRKGTAVAWLAADSYTVNAKIASARRIGNNMFFQMCGRFGTDDVVFIPDDRAPTGRAGMFIYNWNYLRENVLDSFPVMALNGAWSPDVDRWKAEGRKVIWLSGVYPTAQECEEKWEQHISRAGGDGIVTDEFVIPTERKNPNDASLGYKNRGNGFNDDIFDKMRQWHSRHPDKTFWGWLGLPWNANSEDAAPLLKVLEDIDGILLWESYAHTRNVEEEMELRYRSRIDGFRKAAGDYSRIVVAPGTYEFMDKNAYVDFKVFLDMQLNLVATHPGMPNVCGISLWCSYYMEPEILRWYAALVQHYAIDGEKEMLSKKYGFTLRPGLLKNADWETLEHWKTFGKATRIDVKQSGLPPSAYFPRSVSGMLRLRRGLLGGSSGASQTVKGLAPGHLYSASVLAVNPEQDGGKVIYDVELVLDDVEIVEKSVRQVHDFMHSKKPTFNHIKVVFRAKKPQAMLTVRRCKKKSFDGDVLVDSISVKPYFLNP